MKWAKVCTKDIAWGVQGFVKGFLCVGGGGGNVFFVLFFFVRTGDEHTFLVNTNNKNKQTNKHTHSQLPSYP